MACTNSGFQKIIFHLPENQDLFLIQYIGDDLLVADQPHENTYAEATIDRMYGYVHLF